MTSVSQQITQLLLVSARQTHMVELRYFDSLIDEETAEGLKGSVRTVKRDWNLARLSLYRELQSGGNHDA